MKTILVTGGAGFLGSNLCHKLIHEYNTTRVVCLDNFYTGRRENIADLLDNPRFMLLEHDIVEPLVIDIAVDEIYNLACPASPPHYQKNPVYTTKTNVIGVLNMLELAKKNDARILQASTSEVYGDPQVHPQIESYLGNVNCTGVRACYDEGKRCAESLMSDYHRMYGTKTKIIRIFNTYGPNMSCDDGRVVSNFICQSLRGDDITIYGDGSQTRSLCYVDDLLEGMVRMMASEDEFTGPVNLGNPEEHTILELAEIIRELTGSKAKIRYCSLPKDDPTQRRPNVQLAHKKLKWRPCVSVVDGLKRTLECYLEKEIKHNDAKK